MDVRATGWYAQLTISGVSKPINSGPGSLVSLTAEILRALQSQNPRELTNGKHIGIKFAQTQFSDAKDDSALNDKVREVTASLDATEITGPGPDEDYESFYLRLVSNGLSREQAEFIANDWFNRPPDVNLHLWLNDPKAIRFRQLNSSPREFEKAMAGEYLALKDYVCREYPKRVENLTFRIA